MLYIKIHTHSQNIYEEHVKIFAPESRNFIQYICQSVQLLFVVVVFYFYHTLKTFSYKQFYLDQNWNTIYKHKLQFTFQPGARWTCVYVHVCVCVCGSTHLCLHGLRSSSRLSIVPYTRKYIYIPCIATAEEKKKHTLFV